MAIILQLEKVGFMGNFFLGVLCCLISKEIDFCGLERCKSLNESEFDCSWQSLSHSFQLGRANMNCNVFPKHVREEGQGAGTVFYDLLSQSDLS